MSVAVIALIEASVLLGIDLFIDVLSGAKIPPIIPKWTFIFLYSAIFVLNFYFLVFCRYGVKFEREFDHFKRSKKIQLVMASVTVMLAAIAFFIYAANIHRNIIAHNK